jgi:hypothetical protein
MDADMHNAYFALTDDANQFAQLDQTGIVDIINGCNKENSVKGDEFVIEGTFYENKDDGASKTDLTDKGDKVASAIAITGGPNKGKKAIIVHHKLVGETAKIINSIYEVK